MEDFKSDLWLNKTEISWIGSDKKAYVWKERGEQAFWLNYNSNSWAWRGNNLMVWVYCLMSIRYSIVSITLLTIFAFNFFHCYYFHSCFYLFILYIFWSFSILQIQVCAFSVFIYFHGIHFLVWPLQHSTLGLSWILIIIISVYSHNCFFVFLFCTFPVFFQSVDLCLSIFTLIYFQIHPFSSLIFFFHSCMSCLSPVWLFSYLTFLTTATSD